MRTVDMGPRCLLFLLHSVLLATNAFEVDCRTYGGVAAAATVAVRRCFFCNSKQSLGAIDEPSTAVKLCTWK